MIFFVASLAVSFFIFLFSLYSWAKDDFILLRKNITLEQLFNYSFTSVWVMLFSARIFYVFLHPSLRYINPLIFLIFIYFPGLSLTGGVIGMLLFMLFITRKKTIPRGRFYDVFSLAFLPALVSNVLLTQLLDFILLRKISLVLLLGTLVLLIITVIFSVLFKKDKSKDGSIALGAIAMFSIVTLSERFFTTLQKKSLLFDKEVIVLVLLFILAIVLFIRQRVVRRKR